MHITVLGGGLQGVEVCWLARKAGIQTLLVDAVPLPPALFLADAFIQSDVCTWTASAHTAVQQRVSSTSIVVPACENPQALAALVSWCKAQGMPLAFDPKAYAISSCKVQSRALFQRCGLPIPEPAAGTPSYPLIAKPARGSGSRGVCLIHSEAELYAALPQGLNDPHWIVESYCAGPSFSMEVCGTPGAYTCFATTSLLMDDAFDCQGVFAPSEAPPAIVQAMQRACLHLAENIALHGLMDLEVIQVGDTMRILEIDARFPSQTPTVVYLSTGVNLLEHLLACFIPYTPHPAFSTPRYARYEHVACIDGTQCLLGEHVMCAHGSLQSHVDFFGADEALIAQSSANTWVATLMFVDTQPTTLLQRRNQCLKMLETNGL